MLPNLKYYRISKAAEILGSTVEDLVNLGAGGNLVVLAPVLTSGRFSWPTDEDRYWIIGIQASVTCEFGAADRVILTASALGEIEALGGTVLRQFYAPDVARKVLTAQIRVHGPETVDGDEIGNRSGEAAGIQVDSDRVVERNDEDESLLILEPFYQEQLREAAINSGVWEAVDEPNSGTAMTTIEHLFVPVSEVARLRATVPGPEETTVPRPTSNAKSHVEPHGNTEVNASKQLEILKFGLWLYRNEIRKVVIDSTKWAAYIEDQEFKMWPEGAPLKRSVIEKHFRTIFQDDPKKLASKTPSGG